MITTSLRCWFSELYCQVKITKNEENEKKHDSRQERTLQGDRERERKIEKESPLSVQLRSK